MKSACPRYIRIMAVFIAVGILTIYFGHKVWIRHQSEVRRTEAWEERGMLKQIGKLLIEYRDNNNAFPESLGQLSMPKEGEYLLGKYRYYAPSDSRGLWLVLDLKEPHKKDFSHLILLYDGYDRTFRVNNSQDSVVSQCRVGPGSRTGPRNAGNGTE